mgnify:CR=1 FL=1
MKTVDIVERIEGEAKLNLTWKDGKVIDSRIDFLNFRGFEFILKDKSILDALIYTPRICGICGQAHLKATVEAIENLYKNANIELEISNKAKILRELGLIIEIIDSHIKWFYMFIMPDIVKLSKKEYKGYEPLKGNKWLEAQKSASDTIKALALYAGQWPHTSYMIPGGVMSDPTLLDMVTCENYIDQAVKYFEKSVIGLDLDLFLSFDKLEDSYKIFGSLRDFIDISFENGFENLGKSYNRHIVLADSLAFKSGVYSNKTTQNINLNAILESSDYTFDLKNSSNKNAHTWSKSVTYNEEFFETGPLSRAIIKERKFIKSIHEKYDDSVFTRVMARVDELGYLLFYAKELISKIDISEASFIKPKIDINTLENVKASSVIEACRGSLFHNVEIKNGKISSYDVITPTVWNLGPENKNELGIAQKAILASKSLEEATIILRSFDVCSVCTTH